MLRTGVSLPLRLLQDATPVQRHIPNLTTAIKSQWQRPFSTTDSLEGRRGPVIKQVQKLKKKKRYANPQQKRASEMRLRKNVARQAVLQAQRTIDYGEPIHGRAEPTEFVRSFDEAVDGSVAASGEERVATVSSSAASGESSTTVKSPLLNAFIRANELEGNLTLSRKMTEPVPDSRRGAGDPSREERRRQRHEADHGNASEALKRILAVDQASSKQRKHINIQRCIERFGRHNTDQHPSPEAAERSGAAVTQENAADESLSAGTTVDGIESQKNQRIGPDTGSSEVQVAILTMKIRKLAQEWEGPLRRDKINKRNLRLLLHKRQRILKYFYKKDRGGPRWKNLMETLGLTDATWRDEISLK